MSADSTNGRLLINMQIIKDGLEDIFDISYFSAPKDELILSQARIYYGQDDLDPSCVYVAGISEFEKYPVKEAGVSIITNAWPKDAALFKGSKLIIAADEANWAKLYNCTVEIFSKCQGFNEDLYYILNHDGGLYELSVCAMNFFENPLYIHDDKFNILAMPTWVVGMEKPYIDEATGKQTVSADVIRDFSTSQRYVESLTTQGARLWPSVYNPHRLLYVNIWSRTQTYLGRLLLLELRSPLKPRDFILAEYFVKFLLLAIEKGQFKSSSHVSFENILHEYYTGGRTDEAYLTGRMKLVGWQQNDTYMCIRAGLDEVQSRVIPLEKIGSTLDVILEESFSFSENHAVYNVCNLSKAGFTPEILKKKMADFCSSLQIYVSLSNIFTDFSKLCDYYRLADKAFEIGSHKDPSLKFFPFSDYCLDYILTHFTNEFPVEAVASGAVLKLKDIDEKKGTGYIETLKTCFECNFVNTLAADELYIHRSTLEYRLRRIQEIGQIDLSDAKTRLYVQISLQLI